MNIDTIIENEPPILGDHPALDLLNTVVRSNGELLDFLQSDDDVTRWLKRMALVDPAVEFRFKRSALLHASHLLRDTIRDLVVRRKAGETGDAAVLNGFLVHAASHIHLVWLEESSPRIEEKREQNTPEQVLAPIATAAAALLAEADFQLIRPCEDKSCVLWFYDRTKSHRRRWCNMATCGNRHKVAAFRDRRRQSGT